MFKDPDDDRSDGELEFQSWIERLIDGADAYCAKAGRHIIDTSPPPPGYYGVCMACGHHINLPF